MTEFYPMGNVVRRAIAVLRHQGLKSFWFKMLGEFGYRRMLLFERSLAESVSEVTAGLPVHVDILQESEVDDYLAFRPDTPRTSVMTRLTLGHQCYLARHEGCIVAACWTATRPVWNEYLDCEIGLGAGDAYLFDRFTLPAFRGLRIGNAVRMHQLRRLQQAGYRRTISAIMLENKPALRDIAKGGARPFAVIGRIKIGRWQRTFRRRWAEELVDIEP
jgi:GNAT superfamily N-acetyltransferase